MTNESNTMIRKATELDAGSRVVHEGAIKIVRAVQDLCYYDRAIVTMSFTDGSSTMAAAGALFTCV
jgi:hypothetical protein